MGKNQAIEKRKVILQEAIKEISKEDHHPIFRSLDRIDHKSLLALDSLLLFYCADGAIRLGWIDVSDDNIGAWELYDGALEILSGLNLDRMARLSLRSGRLEHQETLLRYLTDRIRTWREFRGRLKANPVGAAFLKHWRTGSGTEERDLLIRLIERRLKATVKGLVRKRPRAFLDKEEKLRTPPVELVFRSDLKGIGVNVIDDDKVQDNLTASYDFYGELIRCFEVERYPLSVLTEQLPLEPWDAVAPEIMRMDIKDRVEQFEPILNGDLEKLPKTIYNAWRTSWRRDTDRRDGEAFSIDRMGPGGDDDEAIEADLALRAAVEYKAQGSDPCLEEKKILERICPGGKPLDALDEIIVEERPRKAKKIRRAFELWVLYGYSKEDALKEAGISKNMINIYVKKLVEKHQ